MLKYCVEVPALHNLTCSQSTTEILEKVVEMSKVKIKDCRTRFRSAVFICNFESISHLFQVFLLMTFDHKFQDILCGFG